MITIEAMNITRETIDKIHALLNFGLVKGLGQPEPGKMCVEAAINYALGRPHGDDPGCVSPVLRHLKIRLNDANWSSNKARAEGMRRLAIAQLGSKDVLDETLFARKCDLAVVHLWDACIRAAVPAYADAKLDRVLSDFAESIVQILIEMKAPGVQWL